MYWNAQIRKKDLSWFNYILNSVFSPFKLPGYEFFGECVFRAEFSHLSTIPKHPALPHSSHRRVPFRGQNQRPGHAFSSEVTAGRDLSGGSARFRSSSEPAVARGDCSRGGCWNVGAISRPETWWSSCPSLRIRRLFASPAPLGATSNSGIGSNTWERDVIE